jgi:hypothetical protein
MAIEQQRVAQTTDTINLRHDLKHILTMTDILVHFLEAYIQVKFGR